jgi:hypothetical protein
MSSRLISLSTFFPNRRRLYADNVMQELLVAFPETQWILPTKVWLSWNPSPGTCEIRARKAVPAICDVSALKHLNHPYRKLIPAAQIADSHFRPA